MSDLQTRVGDALRDTYDVERELGTGGMAIVFLARDRKHDRSVAIKVLRPELAATLGTQRFLREIRIAARLNHPHILPLHDSGAAGDILYYVMPYVEGESLRARLSREPPLPVDEAVAICRQVAGALAYAHHHGIVHRDIKPDNILLHNGEAVVTDFGIGKAITAATQAGSGTTLTGRGIVVGTPAYMAPEQAAGDLVDSRADLYSWGVIAYEMLAGVHPFASHTTARALLAAHISGSPVPLAERCRDLPAAMTTLVDRCLSKDPSERPADASTIVSALGSPARVPVQSGRRLKYLAAGAVAIALVAGAGAWLYRKAEARRWAREAALPEARRLYATERTLAALLTLRRAARELPADTQIARAMNNAMARVTVASSPPGATVAIQDYVTPDSAWYTLGTTPLTVGIPKGYLRWKVSKPGLGEYVAAPETSDTMKFALDSALRAPEGTVPVRAGTWYTMIGFVGWVGPYDLPAFDLDKFEVTNHQYQAFVDQGGYLTPKYWKEPFVRNGRALTWAEAMALFRDRSGRAGPSTWEGGHYPDGQRDYPVSGVSWYEASAYAAFVGKSLPSFAQWYEAAPGELAGYVVPMSNISRPSLAPVGAFRSLGPYGSYDMVGNVREWTMNVLVPDSRFILGGAWSSQTYLSALPEALPPFDRSPENGIRCVRNLGPLPPELTRPIKHFDREFARYRPAPDAVFGAYRVMYAYGRTALNARVEGVVQDTKDWREEKITFDAAYGDERLAAYLFLPKRVRPPYQTVLFFPSAMVLHLRDSHTLGDMQFFDYVIQSGRAVMYPIYQDTYERRTRHTMPGASQDIGITVQRSKDLGRAIDYLETRSDIATDKLAYLGVSVGSAEGVIYTALAQDRLKAVIFLAGGYFLDPPPAGGDQADFAPRLKLPVLMVNGRYDFTFPLARSQEPMFRMLGTTSAHKRHVVLETPHGVDADRPALVKNVLGWLDKYLGRVE